MPSNLDAAPLLAPKKRSRHVVRVVAHWSRVLHTYVSMASFTILLFFAVTGITLNHQDRLNGTPRVTRLSGRIDPTWMSPGPSVDRTRIIATLQTRHHVKGQPTEWRVDDDQVTVSFKGPGYAADVFLDRQTAAYEITETRMGLIAVVNDLHKGRDAGAAWSNVIDISAAVMVFLSLTGLTLLFFLQKRLITGLVILAVGTLGCVGVYAFLVG